VQDMASFVLIPGAGGIGWYWHRVVPLLEEVGHEAIAVNLPGDDRNAGLVAYADLTVKAIRSSYPILVAQSLGGFTAPLVCERVPVRMLIFVNAMIPAPDETPGEWGKTPGPRLHGWRRLTAVAIAPTSTPSHIFSTMFRPMWSSKAKRMSARKPIRYSASRAVFRPGRMFRYACLRDVMTVNFQSSFRGAWQRSGWASP
jgi:pimeloyl-ACP methyl ester carboxylesterase